MPNYLSKGPVSSGFRNTYTSQFVPLPLEIFAKSAEKAQATQDKTIAEMGQTEDALWKVKGVADADNEYINNIKTGFEGTASELANKDLTQRENQDAVKGLIKGVSRDKDLNTIMSNTAKYQEWQKNKEDMIKAGNYHPANDAGQATYEDYAKNGGYKSGKTIDSNIYKYEDARPVQEQYFNNLASLGQDQLGKVGETFYKYGYEGISSGRVNKQAQEAISSYMSTPAAQQEGRMYDLGVKQGSINPKKQSKGDYIFSNFLNAGMERAGMSFKSGIADAKNADNKEKKEAANLGTFASEGQNTLLSGGYDLSNDFNSDGTFKGSGKTLTEHYKETGNPGSAIMHWIGDHSLGNDPKDQQKKLITIAAKLNGKSPQEYYNTKAGPDVKLATTFKTLPTKTADAYQKQFFNPTTGTGVFNNAPVMNVKTGEKGTLTEILRQASDRGDLKYRNSKGEVVTLKLSKNPTIEEIQSTMKEIGVGIKGESPSNYFSPKSLMLGIGNQEILWDRTNNMNPDVVKALEKNGELTPRQVMEHKYEKIKLAPEIEGDEIHYWSDIPIYNAKTGKSAPGIATEKLSNIKLD